MQGVEAMYVALVELDVFSGLSVFYPLTSTSAPTYPLPPPTTLVGALAYPYMRRYSFEDEGEYSAATRLLDYVTYAAAGSEGYVIARDVERVYQAIYQRKERWREEHRDLWYTVAVRGIVRYVDDRLLVFYVSNNPEVLYYSYGITRVGRKESHVSVRSVSIEPLNNVLVKSARGTVFETLFYVPASVAECELATSIHMPKLVRSSYAYTAKPELEEFYVPKGVEPMRCELLEEGALVSVNGLSIAIPRSAIKQ